VPICRDVRIRIRQTELSPFSSTVIRNTVKKPNILSVSPRAADSASSKRRIKAALAKIRDDSPSEIDAILQQVDVYGSGLTPGKFAAASYQSSLIQCAPPKRAKRTVHMSTAAGEIMTDSGRIQWLADKQAAKAQHKEGEKAAKKSKSLAKPTGKRAYIRKTVAKKKD